MIADGRCPIAYDHDPDLPDGVRCVWLAVWPSDRPHGRGSRPGATGPSAGPAGLEGPARLPQARRPLVAPGRPDDRVVLLPVRRRTRRHAEGRDETTVAVTLSD